MSQKLTKHDNTYCCVPQCKSIGYEFGISFHGFPQSPTDFLRRKKWILALRIGKPVSRRMKVCSRHFKKSDYFPPPATGVKRPRLKNNVVPSLNLPVSNLNKEVDNEQGSKRKKVDQPISDKIDLSKNCYGYTCS